MKSTKNLFLLFLLLFLYTGCEKTDDGTYVDPITIYEKLPGTWSLRSIMLVDEIAKANALEPYELDIKPIFNFTGFTITFHIDSSYLPTSYEVQSEAPELFPETGYWDLDNPFVHTDGTPTLLYLYSDEARSQLTDQLSVTTLPGARAELEFKLIRLDNGTPYASYVYKFRQDK